MRKLFVEYIFLFFISLLLLSQSLSAQHYISSNYYDEIVLFVNGYAEVTQNDKYGLINTKGDIVIPCIYDEINANDLSPWVAYGLVSVKKGMFWGAVDSTGKVVLPFKYDNLTAFYDHGISIATKNKKSGCINYKGDTVIPFIYDTIWFLCNGVRKVAYNGRIGYLDSVGNKIVDCKYDGGRDFCEGVMAVMKGNKWGFINKKDSIIIPFMYDNAYGFSEGLANVCLKGESGFIDKKNNIRIPFNYSDQYGCYAFSNGYARVVIDGRTGMIDKTGKTIIPFEYEDYGWDQYMDGCFILERQFKNESQTYALFDSTGKAITGFDYEWINHFGSHKFEVEKKNKYGVIDNKGNIIIPIEYDDHFWVSNYTIYSTTQQGNLVFLDSMGNIAIPFTSESIHPHDFRPNALFACFFDSVAIVPYHNTWRIINRKGQFTDSFIGTQDIRLYYENDVLGTKGRLENFYREGKWVKHYEDGRLKEIAHYKHGLKTGTYKYWDRNGFLIENILYKNDTIKKNRIKGNIVLQ